MNDQIRRAITGAFAFAIALSVHAAQPSPAEKPLTPIPVAKDLLDGTRLVLKAANCSIDLPGTGWNWMTYDKAGKTFLCVNSKTYDIYSISVGELKSETMVAHQPESLIASAKKTQELRGGKVESDKFEFIEVAGTKKAAKVTFTEIDKAQKKSFVCIYILNTLDHILLQIHATSPTAPEPDAAKAIFKSLKMLK